MRATQSKFCLEEFCYKVRVTTRVPNKKESWYRIKGKIQRIASETIEKTIFKLTPKTSH